MMTVFLIILIAIKYVMVLHIMMVAIYALVAKQVMSHVQKIVMEMKVVALIGMIVEFVQVAIQVMKPIAIKIVMEIALELL